MFSKDGMGWDVITIYNERVGGRCGRSDTRGRVGRRMCSESLGLLRALGRLWGVIPLVQGLLRAIQAMHGFGWWYCGVLGCFKEASVRWWLGSTKWQFEAGV